MAENHQASLSKSDNSLRLRLAPAAASFGVTLFGGAGKGTEAGRRGPGSSSSSSSLADPDVGGAPVLR